MNKGWAIICGAIGLLALGVAISTTQPAVPETRRTPDGIPIDGDHDDFGESLHTRASTWLHNQMKGNIQ